MSERGRKKYKSYIPASSSAGYRASICNFPSSGQALSFSDVCGDKLQSAILHRERKRSLRKESSSEEWDRDPVTTVSQSQHTVAQRIKQSLLILCRHTYTKKGENGFLYFSKISVYFFFPLS